MEERAPSPRPAGSIRRHPVAAGISAAFAAAALIFVLAPSGLVSRLRLLDAEIRTAVAPVAQRLDPMHVPPPVNGWEVRVSWLCGQLGLAGNPFAFGCEGVSPMSPAGFSLDFSFRSEEPPGRVCGLVRSFLILTDEGCVAGGKRFGDRFFQLDGGLSPNVVADVQVRRALVAPRGGIVDPEHPVPGATVTTVVSLNASVRDAAARV